MLPEVRGAEFVFEKKKSLTYIMMTKKVKYVALTL